MRILSTVLVLLAAANLYGQTTQQLKRMPFEECMDACTVKGLKADACFSIAQCGVQCYSVCQAVPDSAGFIPLYVSGGAASDSLKTLLNPNGYCFPRNHYMAVTTSGVKGQKLKDAVSTGLKVAAVALNDKTARAAALAGSIAADAFTLSVGKTRVSSLSDRNGNYGVVAEFVNGIALIEFFESNGWHYQSSAAAKDGSQRFIFAQPADNECDEPIDPPVAEK